MSRPLTGSTIEVSRKRQVLDGIAAGQSYQDIAAALDLSFFTVKTYARRLFDDLGVSERAAAVHKGWQLGLLSVTPGTPPLTPRTPRTSHRKAPTTAPETTTQKATT